MNGRFAGRAAQWMGASALMSVLLVALAACSPPSAPMDGAEAKLDRAGDVVVARVEGTPIYRTDVRRAAQAQGLIGEDDPLTTGDPVFTVAVNELIDQRLLSLDAVRTGVAQTQEVQRRLASARERILGNYRVEAHLDETVTDAAVRKLYDAQRELAGQGEERRIRQIVVGNEALATDIVRRLNDEEDFEQLAREHSTDAESREAGGERGWVSRKVLPEEVADAAFSAPVGGRSGPVRSGEDWVVLEVLDTRTPNSRSFEQTREEIARFMTFEAVEALVSRLRDRADVERLYENMADDVADAEETAPEETAPVDAGEATDGE
ncbi:peptidylprolyl isomerase [uncultured Algimonas sp.]|uniref:peptidylprolyl isomerase n=1 Tax=uncultured Algimonas sp. TaxID=1547920 RepID=UPI002625ADA3|nr:peptidylprolyl isomerase [uncultured Algimonas sp.]